MTKRTVLHTLTALWLSQSIAQAQQLPIFAQYAEYHGLINPASVNSNFLTEKQDRSIGVSYRSNLMDFGDLSPVTAVVRFESIERKRRIILGAYLQHDKIGITENSELHGRIAYFIKLNKNLGLAAGLQIGGVNRQLKTSDLMLAYGTDPQIPQKDTSVTSPDLGFGLYFYQKLWGQESQYFYGGLSIPRFGNDKNTMHYSISSP
jgi:type IX secretion system PorP/SprF family membrane protein